MIPTLVSLVAAGLLVVAVAVGLVLLAGRTTAPAGRTLLRYSVASLVAAIIAAWAGVPVCLVLWGVGGEGAGLLGLWASGPVGLILGLLLAWRGRARPRPARCRPSPGVKPAEP